MNDLTSIGQNFIVDGMPADEYHAATGISCSQLKSFRRSAAHFREDVTKPRPPSEAMTFGRLLHLAVLEPDVFAATTVLSEKFDKRTKDGKAGYAAFCIENAGKEVVDRDDWFAIRGMSKSLMAHKAAGEILRMQSKREVSIFATHDETGLALRSRLDLLPAGVDFIPDIKSSEDARPEAFARSVQEYGYHIQAAYYLDNLARVGIKRSRFVFLVVEKKAPYGVAVYDLDQSDIEDGRREYETALRLFTECRELDSWPCYPSEIQPITRPAWAKKVSQSIGNN